MNVLFKNIPIGIRADELVEFIELKFKVSDFERSDWSISPDAVEMLEKQDNFTHPIEQFGLVRISPPLVAKVLIKELDGCFCNGLQIRVREFFNRSVSNDHRLKKVDMLNDFIEQRVNDRRKHILVYSRLI